MGKEQVNMADTSELSLSNASNEKFWPNGWWKLFDLKIGRASCRERVSSPV